ncbi:MAG: response regulator transcription factor [Cyanobacteria bacterium P01_A01_bin.37]
MDVISQDSTPAVLLIGSDDVLMKQMELDLKEAGYGVTASDITLAARQAQATNPALIIVDRLLSGESGLALCRKLRMSGLKTPIVLLMSRDSVDDRVACIESGADDYFLKPYRTDDFLRLVNLYLSPEPSDVAQLRFADLVLDLNNRQAILHNRVIEFTMKEFELLRYLMEHPREVMTREQILENVWGYEFMGESNVIEVYVRYLRLKIEGEGNKRLIQTVRGVGYVLRDT